MVPCPDCGLADDEVPGCTVGVHTCMCCQAKFSLQAPSQCSVCHESTAKTYVLACGHTGCRPGLKRWAESRSTCPICRQPYKLKPGWSEVDEQQFVDMDEEAA